MKTLLTLFCSLLLLSLVSAQGRLQWGIESQLGVSGRDQVDEYTNSSASTIFKSENGTSLSPSIGGGVWGRFQWKPRVGLRLSVLYNNAGQQNKNMSYSEDMITKAQTLTRERVQEFRVHQVQVPLLVEFTLGKGQFQPRLGLGVQLSQDWMGGVYEGSRGGDEAVIEEYRLLPASDEIGKLPLFWHPTASFDAPLGDRLSVGLRYTWAGKEDSVYWSPYDLIMSPRVDGVIFCGCGIGGHRVETQHRHQLHFRLSYEL